MKNGMTWKNKTYSLSSSWARYSLSNLGIKGCSKAGDPCLTWVACTHFIGLSRTLRVCGKQCCFISLHEQSRNVREVLQTHAQHESDNKPSLPSSLLNLNHQRVAHIPLISPSQRTENLQHFDGLSSSKFPSLPTTLICSKKHRLFEANFSSLSSIPEGGLFRL